MVKLEARTIGNYQNKFEWVYTYKEIVNFIKETTIFNIKGDILYPLIFGLTEYHIKFTTDEDYIDLKVTKKQFPKLLKILEEKTGEKIIVE